MFCSTIFPGILQTQQTQSVQEIFRYTPLKEEVAASMPVEKPADHQRTNTSTDEAALSQLYEQYRTPIHSYIYRLLGNHEDADDLTQEVFIRACASWDDLYERGHLSSWLYRIATNLCIDLSRRRKRISWWPLSRRTRREGIEEEQSNDDISYLLADTGGIPEVAERELISATLRDMPEEYAIVLVLNAAQGIPYQEIATVVGISPNAAATRISRAKKMFVEQYQRLSKDGIGKREKRV